MSNIIDAGSGVASGGDLLNSYYSLWRKYYQNQTAGTIVKVSIGNQFAGLIIKPPVKYTPPLNVTPPATVGGGTWALPGDGRTQVAVFVAQTVGPAGPPVAGNLSSLFTETPHAWQELVSIGYGGGLYVAFESYTGKIATSLDGSAWVDSGVRLPVGAKGQGTIGWINGKFILAVTGSYSLAGLWTSSDGISWTRTLPPVGGTHCGFYVTVANGLATSADSSGGVFTSIDGTSWTSLPLTSFAYTSPIANTLGRAPVYDGTTWVMVNSSNGAVWLSADGVTYHNSGVTIPSGTTKAATVPGIICIIEGGTGYVQVSSDHAVSWSRVALPTPIPTSGLYTGIYSANGVLFVLPASMDKIFWSRDGLIWNTTTLSISASWSGIAYNEGYYVLLGSKAGGAVALNTMGSDGGLGPLSGVLLETAVWNSSTPGGHGSTVPITQAEIDQWNHDHPDFPVEYGTPEFLSGGSLTEKVTPPVVFASGGSLNELTAPPLPFNSGGGLVEHASSVALPLADISSGGMVQHMGLPFTMGG